RLDGLPLAIELIAARIKVLSPLQLLERLDALTAQVQNKNQDRPARQQTLRGAIRWSYELLSPPEQRLFAQLGALVGGCTLEAVEAICDAGDDPVEVAELLAGLLDKSLIHCQQEGGAEPRFTMLTMVRDYAMEQLTASGERMALQERAARFFAELAERGDAALRGPQEAAWLGRLAAELDNLRAALGWSLEHGKLDLAHRLAGALWRFWMLRGSVSEGRRWLERTLAFAFEADQPLRAKALHAAGALATLQSDYDQAVFYFNQSLAVRRALDDAAGVANTVQNLGVVSFHRTDYAQAEAFLTEALALYRELGNKLGIAAARTNLGMVVQDLGDYERAAACYDEALAIQRQLGNRAGEANLLAMLGTVAQEQEQYAAARPLLEEALALHRELGVPTITTPLDSMGMVALVAGELALARQCWEECMATAQAAEQPRFIAVALEGFARLAGATGHTTEAAKLWAAADALRAALGVPKAPSIARIHEPFQAAARERLGELDWRLACEAGAAFDAEQAMALARGDWGAAAPVGGAAAPIS
ncbi:MAG TPA: tetratricopeptide repeat protein, partial [Herpetosiphonaceae bacterium]